MSAHRPAPGFDPLSYRGDFPILASILPGDRPLVYLDSAASSQRPRQVIQAMTDVYEKYYANVHRGIHWLADQSTELYEQARAKVRDFLHARTFPMAEGVEEIIFTSGTTAAINLVARTWGDANVRAGDEILLNLMEHHSNIVPWQQLAARTGARVRFAPITDDGLLDLAAFDRLLTDRTRLVAITGVSNVLGTINPVADIIRRAHAVGAKVLVDGAQSVPHEPVNVVELDCDFLAFSGHKMLGPSGIGVLYGKRELLAEMPPFLGGGSMIGSVTVEGFTPAELPKRFEAGTPPIVPAIGLGAAIDYLGEVGLDKIAQHEQALTAHAHERLAAIPQVRLLGPDSDKKAGIVSFVIEKVHAHDVADFLNRLGIAIRVGHHCAMPLHERFGLNSTSRASFYFYNTLDEVDQFVEAVGRVSGGLRRAVASFQQPGR